MGQRSQIYVRYIPYEEKENDIPKRHLIASYFQWNFGERMISRARYTLEWIKDKEFSKYTWDERVKTLRRIMEVNFNYKDVVLSTDIVKEFIDYADKEDSFYDYVFAAQDNNDGKLLIDVSEERIKYAFIGNDFDETHEVYDAEAYMDWNMSLDDKSWRDRECMNGHVKYTERNIRKISKVAKLMSLEEVEEFMHYDYEKSMGLVRRDHT